MEAYQLFEQQFAEWAGVENVVGCSSGTSALHLALESLQLPLGSEVITSDFSMIAVPRAIALAGLVPVFVDCGSDLLLDSDLLDAAVTERTSAIVAPHIYGRVCHEDVVTVAKRHGLRLIEDCAEAHMRLGWCESADASCFSFYRNKIIAGEEGGAIAFRDPSCAKLARQLRSLGFTDAHDFNHLPRGHNYRLSNAHALLILDSLAKADANIAARREIEAWYDAVCPAEWLMPPRIAAWVYDIRIPGIDSETQSKIVHDLQSAGIAARHAFKLMSMQAEFASCRRIESGNAYAASTSVVYLPIQPGKTTAGDCKRAFDTIARTTAAAGVPVSEAPVAPLDRGGVAVGKP